MRSAGASARSISGSTRPIRKVRSRCARPIRTRSRWSTSACSPTGATSSGCAPRSASWRRSRRRPSSTACAQRSSRPIIPTACAACRRPACATRSRWACSPRCSKRCRGWRGWMIDTLVTSGVTLADVLADDAALDAYLNKAVAGVWHPVGSCRMGRDDDPLAVTTPHGSRARRRGLARVRRLGDAVDPVRQHEHSDHHGGGAHGGSDQGRACAAVAEA